MDFKTFKKTINSPVDFEVSQVGDQIFVLNFQSKDEMTLTMLRFNEHYECKQFKGKTFSHEKYYNWYKKHSGSNKFFRYNEIIQGYLIPSKALKPFHNYKFRDLSLGEIQILKVFSKIKKQKFAIITLHNEYNTESENGGLKDRKNTYYHELAHSFYSLFPKYKKDVDSVINSIDNSIMEKFLDGHDYRKEVFNDETNSYLVHDQDTLKEEGVDFSGYSEVIKELKKLFKEQKSKVNLKKYSRKKEYKINKNYDIFFEPK